MHYSNLHLPVPVEKIQEDGENSLKQVFSCLEQLLASEDYIETSVYNRFSIVLSNHRYAEYGLTVADKSRICNSLFQIYSTKRLSVPLKQQCLDCINQFVAEKHTLMDFTVQWKTVWEEILSLILLDESSKAGLIASHSASYPYTSSLITFINRARPYIAGNGDDIVLEAMSLLSDTNNAASMAQGITLLVNCLPTNYHDYDRLLPQWLKIWDQIDNNAKWDSCWLTLLCRARKYTQSFDWSTLSPLLQIKARSLMKIPGVKVGSPTGNEFPLSFSQHYNPLLPVDAHRTGIHKISKLLYFLTIRDGGSGLCRVDPMNITVPRIKSVDDGSYIEIPTLEGFNTAADIQTHAGDIVLFLQSLRPLLNPTNNGNWTPQLGHFITVMVNEICKHVGRSLASHVLDGDRINAPTASVMEAAEKLTLRNHPKNARVGHVIFEGKVHVPTVRFLCSTLMVLVLEGLYGRNQSMKHKSANCIKNLVYIDPLLGGVIMPFLLQALDSNALTQSHQAPAAMHALAYIIKPLLYPCPLALDYLPSLLKLSLPGIDASDDKKTCMTLNMYYNLLDWLPVRASFDGYGTAAIDAPYYLTLVSGDASYNDHLKSMYNAYFDPSRVAEKLKVLTKTLNEWSIELLDRVFVCLQAQEAPKDRGATGKKGTTSQVPSYLIAVVDRLFNAIDHASNQALAVQLAEKIVSYFKANIITNAEKTCAKIIGRVMISNGVLPLSYILDTYLDSDLLSLQCSSEKISFRLRLIAGTICICEDKEQVVNALERVKPLLSEQFYTHSDKSIRKASGKLLKEVCRSLTAYFPQSHRYSASKASHSGYTTLNNTSSVIQMELKSCMPLIYGRPTAAVLNTFADWLKTVVIPVMHSVEQDTHTLTNTVFTGTNGDASESMGGGDKEGSVLHKRIEESLTQKLAFIGKAVRGGAEIWGDDTTVDSSIFSQASSDPEFSSIDIPKSWAMEEGREDEQYGNYDTVVHTGREALHAQLQGDNLAVYTQFRTAVLALLKNVAVIMYHGNAAGSHSPTSAVASIMNSVSLHQIWIKIFGQILCIRSAFISNTNQFLQILNYHKDVSRSSMIKYVRKAFSLRGYYSNNSNLGASIEENGTANITSMDALITTYEYWSSQDSSSNYYNDRIWLQHAIRASQYSYASMRHILKGAEGKSQGAKGGQLYMDCLSLLSDMCCHQYDEIRAKALKGFGMVQSQYGYRVATIARRMIRSNLTLEPNGAAITFPKATGTLNLLRQSYYMRRMMMNPSLNALLLKTLNTCPAALATIQESDKREILFANVADIFTQYSHSWFHLPLKRGDRPGKGNDHNLLESILNEVGFAGKDIKQIVTQRVPASTSLRQATFAGFSLMTFLGHEDTVLPVNVWMWALRHLSDSHDQPTQMLAIATLCRLSLLGKSSSNTLPAAAHQALAAVLDPVSTGDRTSIWKGLLTGLMMIHPKSGEDATDPPQWSAGVGNVLRYSSGFKSIKSHRDFSLKFESNLHSTLFYIDHCCMLVNLIELGLVPFTLESVNALLNLADTVETSSETERKSKNATAAELYAALLRYALAPRRVNNENTSSSTILSQGDQLRIIETLISYHHSKIEDVSIEFSKDWHEALVVALNMSPSSAMDGLYRYAIQSIETALISSSNGTGSVTESDSASPANAQTTNALKDSKADSDEGFSRQGKLLGVTHCILSAYVVGLLHPVDRARHSQNSPSQFDLGLEVLKVLHRAGKGVICAYRSSRIRITNILVSVVECCENRTLFSQLIDTLVSACQNIDEKDTISIADSKEGGSNEGKERETFSKNAHDTVSMLLNVLITFVPPKTVHDLTPPLLEVCIQGSGHADIDTAKLCHDTTLFYIQAIREGIRDNNVAISTSLSALQKYATHSSWHVRETVMLSYSCLMTNNWPSLTADEKKGFKEAFTVAFTDEKPEVVKLAQAGFVMYLGNKSRTDVQAIAEAFCRNSDKYIALEKRNRKAAAEGDKDSVKEKAKPDPKFVNMVMMMSCIILSFPYDLPSFLPLLLTCFVRHRTTPSLKTTISKTVLEFKRTHQDRWEELKDLFTRDQLDSIDSASSLSYMA